MVEKVGQSSASGPDRVKVTRAREVEYMARKVEESVAKKAAAEWDHPPVVGTQEVISHRVDQADVERANHLAHRPQYRRETPRRELQGTEVILAIEGCSGIQEESRGGPR